MSAGHVPECLCLCLSFSQTHTHTPPSQDAQSIAVGALEGPNRVAAEEEEEMNEEEREL